MSFRKELILQKRRLWLLSILCCC